MLRTPEELLSILSEIGITYANHTHPARLGKQRQPGSALSPLPGMGPCALYEGRKMGGWILF